MQENVRRYGRVIIGDVCSNAFSDSSEELTQNFPSSLAKAVHPCSSIGSLCTKCIRPPPRVNSSPHQLIHPLFDYATDIKIECINVLIRRLTQHYLKIIPIFYFNNLPCSWEAVFEIETLKLVSNTTLKTKIYAVSRDPDLPTGIPISLYMFEINLNAHNWHFSALTQLKTQQNS